MTVEDIYQDREGFAIRVREVAATDMSNMGLEIVSFTIRDIQDEQGYLVQAEVEGAAAVQLSYRLSYGSNRPDSRDRGAPE